jgi:glycosyltransferase involved in cell wall biosynthesis
MNRTRFRPAILTLSPEDEKTAVPDFESMEIPVDSLSMSRYGGVVKGMNRVREEVKRREPDILHTQGLRPDFLSATAVRGVTRVATARNYPYDDYPMKYGSLRGYPAAWTHLFAFRRLDKVVACSNSIGADLARHDIRAQVLHNGVDTSIYQPGSEEQKRELRQKLDLPIDRDIFVSVGSLISRKKPKTVVDGFLRSDHVEHSQLVMLGDGPLRDDCEAVARRYPEAPIAFRGFVDNVREYLQASDFFISASLSEGLPNTVLEALASGLPVALSDIGPHRETIQTGRAGVLFDTNSATALAEGVNRLREMDTGELGREARQLACDKFSAEKMSLGYQTLYKNILGIGQTETMSVSGTPV